MSTPDTVRLAMPAEAVDVARLQRRSWAANPALASVLAQVNADETALAWHEAISKPPMAHYRVLVAQGKGQIVGFTVTGPNDDPDAETTDGLIAEFVVDDNSDEVGHDARLINAAVDTLRADGYETASMWIPSDADELRTFLIECGWAADGAHREVGADEESSLDPEAIEALKLIRLRTDIREAQG